jgi:uncharacterized membrane protein YqjE
VAFQIIDRSIAALLKDIVGNVQQIIRAEVRLAKVEVREELTKARRASSFIVIGGVFGALALAFALVGARDLLARVVDPWTAAFLVALGAGLVGGTLIAVGVRQLKLVTLPPPRTVTSVQENIQWAKAQTR